VDRPEFVKDLASQRLNFTAQEGRPSTTPTVGVKDNAGTELSAPATTNVTIKTTDTTITASALAGAQSVTVDATTGLELGATYRLVNALNQVEWVTVKGWSDSTKIVELKSELEFNFNVDRGGSDYGDFESTEFYYELQSAEYDTLRELNVATASYAVAGTNYQVRRTFDVVLSPLDNPLTVAAIYQRWPDIARQEHDETRGEDFLDARIDAWSTIKRRIRQQTVETEERWSKRKKWRPAMIVDVSDFFEAAMAQLKLNLHLRGISVDRDKPTREQLEKDRDDELSIALNTISWLDVEEDESLDEGEAARLGMCMVR
jgi:hypothetical protein